MCSSWYISIPWLTNPELPASNYLTFRPMKRLFGFLKHADTLWCIFCDIHFSTGHHHHFFFLHIYHNNLWRCCVHFHWHLCDRLTRLKQPSDYTSSPAVWLICWLFLSPPPCLEPAPHVSLSRVKWMSTSSLLQSKRRGTEMLWGSATVGVCCGVWWSWLIFTGGKV